MATVRLATYMKESICKALLHHRFSNLIPPLIERQREFADRVFADVVTPKETESLDALPKGWVPSISIIGVQFGESGSRYTQLNLDGTDGINGELSQVRDVVERETVSRRVPYSMKNGCAKVYSVAHPFCFQAEDFRRERESLREQIKKASGLINAQLNAFTTVGALIRNWPEVAPFAERYLELSDSRAVALPRATLNDILGLPVEEERVEVL